MSRFTETLHHPIQALEGTFHHPGAVTAQPGTTPVSADQPVFADVPQATIPPNDADVKPAIALPAPSSEVQTAAPAPQEIRMSFLSTALSSVEKFFEGVFNAILGTDEAKQLETAVVSFVKTDVGKLAVDAVQYASTLVGQTDVQLRDAAVAQLKADLKAAGKDAEAIGVSTYNLFIEMAYSYVAGLITKLPEAVK